MREQTVGPGERIAPAPPSSRLMWLLHLLCAWWLAGGFVACAPGARSQGRTSTGARATFGIVVMDVGPARVPCMGLSPTRCLRVRTLPDTAWLLFYDAIEGFAYEEGFTWQLEVERRRVPNPPADGSSIAYRLVRVITRERVP